MTGWRSLGAEFKKPYYKGLYETVKQEYQTRAVYPDANDIFNAFDFTPLSKVKVVRSRNRIRIMDRDRPMGCAFRRSRMRRYRLHS